MNETDRRRTEGLSPLRGDSRYGTPALSISGELSNASPAVGAALTASLTQIVIERTRGKCLSSRGRSYQRHFRRGRWQNRRLPVSGNYPDYYSRRDPEDRIRFLMPEWFSNGDIADYGCHNGTLTFRILEKFPDIHKIDAFDCDPELIENAKSMQRERIRWGAQANTKYDKINFQVANWSECTSFDDEPTYNTILAFSVTKWIHLNYGDAGLMRFFRRAVQQENYKGMTIDPSNLEPLLLDVGFSYFDKIKVPRPNEAFQRNIILCSKSYGITPSSIRNDCRRETQMWRDSPSSDGLAPQGPPPVNYCPQTPSYTALVSPRSSVRFPTPEPSTATPDSLHFEVISSTVSTTEATSGVPVEASPLLSIVDNSGVIVSVPDSTSEQ
ncbi:unnamed protein product [Schistocephalus solidus]|uniref:RNA methyltransferase n=1 Tax=Schistocephalus solidus TaxID=70667 RepID=A0A183S811_SCHSO|nr:unnamed protein product [Schistocephalus solidus]